MLIVATVCGHTAVGGTAVIRDNGVGFSRQCIVRRIVTATPRHPVPARVAKAKRVLIPKLVMLTLLLMKSRSRGQ